MFNRINQINKSFNQYNNKYHSRHNTSGFTLLECAIAAILISIALGSLMKLAFTVIKNTTFDQKIADSKILITQKNTALFKDLANQISKIPSGQSKAGSVDPTAPIRGYYDFLNESGCLILNQSSQSGSGASTGLVGSGSIDTIGSGSIDTTGGLASLDCSLSTSTTPSNSTIAKYRRQWLISKDFPNHGDVSLAVTIVYQQTNQIADTFMITKTDGTTTK